MTEFYVVWETNVDADSPREAAEQARADQTRPGTWATVFDVREIRTGKTTRVDLLENESVDYERPPSMPWPWESNEAKRRYMERSP